MIALLIIAHFIIFPTPTEADLVEMGAIVNGEAGGMGREALWFVAEQIRLDWYRLGTKGLDSRWYAYKPDSTGAATELMRDVFNAPVTPEREWCLVEYLVLRTNHNL